MDALVDEDPELALEMVKLLGNELKSVKAQLRDLQSQRATSAASVPNSDAARMAAENAELRERLRELEARSGSQGSVKKEPCDDDDLLQQKEKIIQRQSEDLDKLYRDMQKLKKENERLLQESASQQQVNIEMERDVLESEKATADARQQVQRLQVDLAASSIREKGLAAELQIAKETYSPSRFLEKSQRAKGSQQPTADKLKAYRQPEGAFHLKPAHKAKSPHDILALRSNEVLWPAKPADKISRAVAILPAHVNRAAMQSIDEASEWAPQAIKPDQTIEIFHQGAAEGWWLYMGTYVCRAVVQTTLQALPLDELQICVGDVVDAVMARALDKDLVAPLLFQSLKSMFKEGLLQVCCVELECVGFNRRLYNAVLSMNSPYVQNAQTSTGCDAGAHEEGPAGHVASKRKRTLKGKKRVAQDAEQDTAAVPRHVRQEKRPKTK